MSNPPNEYSSSELGAKYNSHLDLWNAAIKNASHSSLGSAARREAYEIAIYHTREFINYILFLLDLAPDEYYEHQAGNNIFKKSVQQSLLSKLKNEMAGCLNNLADNDLKIDPRHFNPALHPLLSALEWDDTHESVIQNIWYCMDIADKFMCVMQKKIPKTDQNIFFTREYDIGYDVLKANIKHPDAAISAFQRSIEFVPDSAPAYHSLGIAYSQADMQKEAIAAWRKVKKLDDNYNFEYRFRFIFDN